ncbi:hypothetical protein HZH66_014246 [Vespula vulgaris]|uniref:Secreted protein n=1 Tax=Vespula vulgaris TaxID=7454 RepID=A0A834MQD0_VESVU|nr:hypothetical protein HZH66_014246 [Vespula vulgaris]
MAVMMVLVMVVMVVVGDGGGGGGDGGGVPADRVAGIETRRWKTDIDRPACVDLVTLRHCKTGKHIR